MEKNKYSIIFPNLKLEGLSYRTTIFYFIAVFIIFALIKAPTILIDTRMWGEEGTHFYEDFLNNSFFENLLFVHIGSYQLFANMAVAIAALVPIRYASLVTTYFALVIHCIVAAQVGIFVATYRISIIVGTALLIFITFCTQSYEIWLSSTNIQWWMGVSMILLLVLPDGFLRERRIIVLTWSALCGFSGIPACVIAPFFLFRGLKEGSTLLAVGLVLSLCALTQIFIIYTYGTPGRVYSVNTYYLFVPTVLQTIFAPLFGGDLTDQIAKLAKKASYSELSVAIINLNGLAFTLALGLLSIRAIGASKTYVLLGAWLTTSLVQTIGALDAPALISGWNGARYLMSGVVCLALLLALVSTSQKSIPKWIASGLLILIASVGCLQWYLSPSLNAFLTGPSWPSQVQTCNKALEKCPVVVWPGTFWPGGSGSWTVHIPKNLVW